MPVAVDNDNLGIDALDQLCEALSSSTFQQTVGGNGEDLQFLTEFLNNPVISTLVQAQDALEDTQLEPTSCDTIELLRDLTEDLDQHKGNASAQELKNILTNPHIKSLIDAHDDIAAKNYEPPIENFPIFAPPPEVFSAPSSDAIRMVGIRKNPGEPLGITVRKTETGDLTIARIMAGSMIEVQGLLHVDDIIKEVNGQEVNDPDQLMEILRHATGSVTLKILPSYYHQHSHSAVYLKSHFTYDPRRDNLIPCREAGLFFREGEILQVLNMEDNNWWQAQKVDSDGSSGLIPSQVLEEKRKAFVKPEHDYTHKSLLCGFMTKKKKKQMYKSTLNTEFDRTDLKIYEEVARMPPFQRKSLVLIGAAGVGRRTLKQRFCKADPNRFGNVLPSTSRPMRRDEVDGHNYWFYNRDEMEYEVNNGKYLEHGELDGNFYGTKYDHIRQVIRQGKMCILDLNPTALKQIKTSEFMPYVVFIAAPPVEIMRNMNEYARIQGKTDKIKTEREFRKTLEESAQIEREYRHFFDFALVNDNMNECYTRLRKAIETLSTEPQWVPVSWVY